MQQAGAGLVEVGTGGVLPPGQVQVQVLGHGILTVFNYPAATSATYHCPSSPRTQSMDTSPCGYGGFYPQKSLVN